MEIKNGSGTHLDAPYHFFPNLKKVQDIDLEFLSGITYIIDMG